MKRLIPVAGVAIALAGCGGGSNLAQRCHDYGVKKAQEVLAGPSQTNSQVVGGYGKSLTESMASACIAAGGPDKVDH